MGLTFSTVIVRADAAASEKQIIDAMKKVGYRSVQEGDEGALALDVYQRDGSKWFAFGGEVLIGSLDVNKLAKLLAKRICAPALAIQCLDSDFMILSLVDPETGKASKAMVGHPYDKIKRPSADPAAWQAVAERETDFAALFKGERVFAEDVLRPLGEALGFAPEDAYACEDFDDTPVMRLYFDSVDREPVYLEEGLPVLQKSSWFVRMNVGQTAYATISNLGGPSKGFEALVYGAFAERDELQFPSVSLRYWRDHFDDPLSWRDKAVSVPAEKVALANGMFGYRFSFPDAEIPRGVNPKQKKYRAQALHDLETRQEFILDFTPQGDANREFLVNFQVVPYENERSATTWSVPCIGEVQRPRPEY